MKPLFLNNIISASQKRTKYGKGLYLSTTTPVYMAAQVNMNKNNSKSLSVLCRNKDMRLLKLFAKAVFIMYRKQFGEFPSEILFLLPGKKISLKRSNLDMVNLNPLLKIIHERDIEP